jgi:hypothetical protein
MSANSLAQLAVDRDKEPPHESVKTATEVLVAAVPSEALAAYTAVIGIVLAADIGATYSAFRWTAYGVFVALAALAPLVVYRHRVANSRMEKRVLPIPECLTAALAAAAWGLVMPGGPLSIVMQGNALVFATAAIALGAATIIGFATQLLGTANRKNPRVQPADQHAGVRGPGQAARVHAGNGAGHR